jgi:hypothetical protein
MYYSSEREKNMVGMLLCMEEQTDIMYYFFVFGIEGSENRIASIHKSDQIV